MKKAFKERDITGPVIIIISAAVAVIVCLILMAVGFSGKSGQTDGPTPPVQPAGATPGVGEHDADPTPATQPTLPKIEPSTTEPSETLPPDTAPSESAASESTPPEAEPLTPDTQPDSDTESIDSEAPEYDDCEGMVFLTFDDGPSKLTPQVLDILKEYGVNATFFVVGFDEDDTTKINYIKRAYEEGNQIGLHGYSHKYADIYQSLEAATDSFYRENKLIYDTTGIDTKLMRFPGGSSNTVSKKYCENVMTDAARELTANGYNYFDWNVSSKDAGEAHDSSDDIYNNVIKSVKHSRVNVVLMHDGNGHQATVEALPQIIETLIAEGYEFGVLSDNVPSVRHKISN